MEYGLYLIKFIRADGGVLKSIEIYYVVCFMKNEFCVGVASFREEVVKNPSNSFKQPS